MGYLIAALIITVIAVPFGGALLWLAAAVLSRMADGVQGNDSNEQ